MVTPEEARKIVPDFEGSNEELEQILKELYELAELAFDCWQNEEVGSKIIKGLLPEDTKKDNINL